MIYSLHPMRREHIAQVTEIDREAFPTQLPPANYRQELQNHLARYIIVYDDTRTVEEPEVKPAEVKPDKGLSRLIRWFNRNHPQGSNSSPSCRQYIIGFTGIWMLADEAHITNIAVRQQYQRQGIGELLLIATIDLAQKMKASILTLEVRASNLSAQNLYRKYSFTQVGVRHGYYLDNKEDGILMSTESIASAVFQTRLRQLREDLNRRWGYVLTE